MNIYGDLNSEGVPPGGDKTKVSSRLVRISYHVAPRALSIHVSPSRNGCRWEVGSANSLAGGTKKNSYLATTMGDAEAGAEEATGGVRGCSPA